MSSSRNFYIIRLAKDGVYDCSLRAVSAQNALAITRKNFPGALALIVFNDPAHKNKILAKYFAKGFITHQRQLLNGEAEDFSSLI